MSRTSRLFRAAALSSSLSTLPGMRPLMVGDLLKLSRKFTEVDVQKYSSVVHDFNPIHSDGEFARSGGFEGGPVVHGFLVASLFPSIISDHFPGAVYASQSLQFKLPVYIGDEVSAEVEASNIKEWKKKFIVKFATRCYTNTDHLVVNGEAIAVLPTLCFSK